MKPTHTLRIHDAELAKKHRLMECDTARRVLWNCRYRWEFREALRSILLWPEVRA